MLNYNKIKTLLIFVHSRLSGKYANYDDVYSKPVIEDEIQAQKVTDDLKELESTLSTQGFTMDHLNDAPYNAYIDMITYYYKVALKEMEKHIKEGDEIIEGVIALSVLSYIHEEKEIKVVDKTPSYYLAYYEKTNIDKKLVYKMLDVGTKVVEAVQSANYTRWLKSQRKTLKKVA